jgi:hypothetical protein
MPGRSGSTLRGQHDVERGGRGGHPRRHEIVPAGVPESRERVVLGDEADGRPRTAARRSRDDRGRNVRDPGLDAVAVAREHLADPADRLGFLKPDLGVRVNPKREFARLGLDRLKRRERARLQCRRIGSR